MKQRLADFVADFLVDHGVKDVFSVVGGGAMHLNDALGHHVGLKVTYNHHEQACAIAAEAYARIDNKIAAVCVTTGPGGTNALTGVVGGWLDSIPMFIISGQVRYDTTARYEKKATGANLRAEGDQEYDITLAAAPMCKYADMLENPNDIRYMLEKAWHFATTGRPGPVWVDIPVNFQGTLIETEELIGYTDDEEQELPGKTAEETIVQIIDMLQKAERPVFYAGNGIRLGNAVEEFKEVIDKIHIPVATYWNSIDLIEDEHPLYVGRGGNMGDRPGNFAVQNADLLIAVGTRISIRQVGYNWETWARAAKVVMVDIDANELKKHTLHVDVPVWADAKEFLKTLLSYLEKAKIQVEEKSDWVRACQNWKEAYPVTLDRHWKENGKTANVYAFIKYLSSSLPENSLTAVSNGACCVAGHQTSLTKRPKKKKKSSSA